MTNNEHIILIIIAINLFLIIGITIIIAFKIARGINFKKAIKEYLNSLNMRNEVKSLNKKNAKYSDTFAIKLNFIDKIELYLIDKSNIRHYIPFMNLHVFVSFDILIFCITFHLFYKILLFIPSALMLSVVISLIPVIVLDLMVKYNSEKVRKRLAEFISILNRWCSVKEDIFYAFEKSLDSGIGEPLNTFIRDMVIQVNRGINPMDALGLLQVKVDNPQFRDFIINIKQNVKHRGNLKKLLDNLEEEFYRIEEEFNRRKISTYKDRLTIYFVMIAVLFTAYIFLRISPEVENFYLKTMTGKMLVAFFCFLYSLGFYITVGIEKIKY